MKKRSQVLQLEGQVSQIKENILFIETLDGCFLFNKEKNSIEETDQSYADICDLFEVEEGKDMGNYKLQDLCNESTKVVDNRLH